jgi:L-threonylcarbamoyladenylate synthase
MAASQEANAQNRADTKDPMTTKPMTRVVEAGPAAVEAAACCLAEGGLLAFPTETVYGLGVDARNGEAIARLYEAKGRPAFNPLICHVQDRAAAARLGDFDAAATRLAQALWPGPLTLVVPKIPDCGVAELATAGLQTIALRVPAHPVAHAILAEFGKPVVAPSANRSGHVSPTTAAHVLADLSGRVDLIIDGGATTVGLESTIVACLDQPVLLRPGGVPRAEIERALGHALVEGSSDGPVLVEDGAVPTAPGQLASHYAPRAGLRLDAWKLYPGEALLAFGPTLPPGTDVAARVLNLSAAGDLIEAAANLFSHLRALDVAGVTMIAVMPVPHQGLGEAINDRLRRGQAPRR